MSTRLGHVLMAELGELRYEPIAKRIRATLGDDTVIDSTRAMLVWEPRRVVPTYAVPEDGLELAPGAAGEAPGAAGLRLGEHRVLDPSIPFGVRSTEGEPLVLRHGAREVEAFRPADPAFAGYVIVDFKGFDAWYEEDERNFAHPRDPFHRIDIVHSSRHVTIELDGRILAESSAPYLLFETMLPVRCYLPPEDVRTELLEPSDKRTHCAYKGEAHYFSAPGEPDAAWFYPAPLREAAEVTDRIAFFNERLDVVVDGERLERPVTPWSRR